jgi:hypothetical protein
MWLRKVLEISGITIIILVGFVLCYAPSNAQRYKPTKAVQEGFKLAQKCHPSNFRIEQFELNVVPGDGFRVFGQDDIGFGLFRRIFIAESVKNNPRWWAHEFLHGFGIIGHPKSVFARCDLD